MSPTAGLLVLGATLAVSSLILAVVATRVRPFAGLLTALLSLPVLMPPALMENIEPSGLPVPLRTVSVVLLFATAVALLGLRNIDPRLSEMARTVGASPLARFSGVVWPQAWPGLAASVTVAFGIPLWHGLAALSPALHAAAALLAIGVIALPLARAEAARR